MQMVAPIHYLIVISWTIIVATVVSHPYHATELYDDNDSSKDWRTNNDDHNHHHHDAEHGHQFSVESGRFRTRNLLNDFFNATTTTTPTTTDHRCGADDPSPELVAESSRIVQHWIQTNTESSRQTTTINVDTYFHVVTANNQTIGRISDADVTNQLQVLNDSFRPYGFTFTLLGTTRNDNDSWYYGFDFRMKSALRVGDASTLNVYFTSANGVLGYARYPWSYVLDPTDDGVVVQSGTIPDGNEARYNEGKTLVHEVGQWLGLLHTFQFNVNKDYIFYGFLSNIFGDVVRCWYNDDGVQDTPKQKSETFGCPTRRDSCLFKWGLDPISNYMNYSDDRCFNEFTTGQMNRMKAMWNEYRAV